MQTVINSYKLDNGLTVMLNEIHTAPIVSHWLWYGVGSRNELPGKTGLSHWVEHMQFKGTAAHTAEEMDHSIARVGGYWNAFTGTDWTTYFETLPAGKLEMVLGFEADRMHNSLFDPQEVELERTVILSEREGGENDPLFRLGEAVEALAFEHHPYRNEVLGSTEDLLNINRADLYAHYQNYYQPSNATICLAGDFSTRDVEALIEKYYGAIPSRPVARTIPQPEETIRESREVALFGPGETTYIEMVYRTPRASSPDFFAYTILDSLLSGPSSLNMFGSGSIGNRTSRLFQALIEKQFAASVRAGLNATIDPGSYAISITCRPDYTPTEVISVLDRELDKVHTTLVSQAEIDKAIKQARALFAYGSDNITNQAFWMGYANSFADYEWYLAYVEKLEAVTPEQVRHAAQVYLSPARRIVGIYRPDGTGESLD